MDKKLYSQKNKEDRVTSPGAIETVCLFEEKASASRFVGVDHAGNGETLKAHELFSIFTADIINQEIVFTR